jgi:hypothetical protein
MRTLCAVVMVCALLVGCGPDQELVASGKAHKCKLQELSKKLKDDPTNTKVAEEIATTSRYLTTVIETADEGKRADLSAAIDKAFAEGCD